MHTRPTPTARPASALAAALALLLFAVPLSAREKERNWQTGKVLDSQGARTYVQVESTTQVSTNGPVPPDGSPPPISSTTATTEINKMTISSTQWLIVSRDFAYIVALPEVPETPDGGGAITRAVALTRSFKHSRCHVIIGDDVKYAEQKGRVYLLDADGKECKFDIVRQERLLH